jgi:hypothetical protein
VGLLNYDNGNKLNSNGGATVAVSHIENKLDAKRKMSRMNNRSEELNTIENSLSPKIYGSISPNINSNNISSTTPILQRTRKN